MRLPLSCTRHGIPWPLTCTFSSLRRRSCSFSCSAAALSSGVRDCSILCASSCSCSSSVSTVLRTFPATSEVDWSGKPAGTKWHVSAPRDKVVGRKGSFVSSHDAENLFQKRSLCEHRDQAQGQLQPGEAEASSQISELCATSRSLGASHGRNVKLRAGRRQDEEVAQRLFNNSGLIEKISELCTASHLKHSGKAVLEA